MDSMLRALLDSQDETERKRLFEELILVQIAPLVRSILRRKLGYSMNPDGSHPSHADAGDLYQQILLSLVARLRDFLDNPAQHPIEDHKKFTISVVTNECNSYLRGRSPERARLKNNLRMILHRHRELASWKGEDFTTICGWKAWKGQPVSAHASYRLAQLKQDPDEFTATRFAGEDLQSVSYARLMAEIFNWLGGPVALDELVVLIAMFRKVKDYPPESIDAADEHPDLQLADPRPRADQNLERQEWARHLWDVIRSMQLNYRRTLCLSPVGEESEEVWDLLIRSGAVSIDELAESLEIPLTEFMNLWLLLPMESAALAEYFGTTRKQVNKWRFRATEQLRDRLGGKK